MIEIKDKTMCCGCSACASICSKHAITMVEDIEGFKYPIVENKLCIDCGLCNKVCPIEYRDKRQIENHYIELLAVRNKNKEDLKSSSSGGFFSIISNYVIENRGVVFGVAYSKSMEVIHTYAENNEECVKFRGSKYVQSNIDGIYDKVKEFLLLGRLVLFSGTPCQVEGLKLFLRKDYDNLITVDLVCHAVPSPKIFKNYVNYVEKLAGERLINLNMRYKGKDGNGWSHKFSYLYVFESGRIEVDWPEISDWGRLYFRNVITRSSCHACRFCNLERPGDFSIADYWDDENKRPDIFSKEGTSLVFVNTKKALEIKQKLLKNFISWKLKEDEAMQVCLQSPIKCNNKRRKEYWTYYQYNGFEKYYKRFFTNSFYIKKRKFLSMIKRKLRTILNGC